MQTLEACARMLKVARSDAKVWRIFVLGEFVMIAATAAAADAFLCSLRF